MRVPCNFGKTFIRCVFACGRVPFRKWIPKGRLGVAEPQVLNSQFLNPQTLPPTTPPQKNTNTHTHTRTHTHTHTHTCAILPLDWLGILNIQSSSTQRSRILRGFRLSPWLTSCHMYCGKSSTEKSGHVCATELY